LALIDLLNISKKFEAQKILCNIEFHLDEGERVALIGKNGSGKSTLMKIIDATVEADEGEIITKNGIKIKRLKQTPTFPTGLSVREAIENELTEFKEAYQKYLSWLTTKKVYFSLRSISSKNSVIYTSRWLVGSSKSKMSGF
jgi:ATP-binding cassette subfamily F protein uup